MSMTVQRPPVRALRMKAAQRRPSLMRRALCLCAAFSLFAACSLDYGKAENSEDIVPEFSFTDAHFVRVEGKKRIMQIAAEKLEQYKSDNASFAQNATFTTYDKDENADTSGSCYLIALDVNKKIYKLFKNIRIHIISQETDLQAESLMFDGNSEQLTSGRDDIVSVKRKNATVSGRGFSASGVSRSYSFLSDVSGSAVVAGKDDEADAEAAEED